MKIENEIIKIKTKGEFDFNDITDEIKNFVKKSGIKNGIINIQTFHTTAVLILNENEPLLLEDIKARLENFAPKSIKYNHDNFEIRTVNLCADECANGHAHCKAILLSPNIVLNVINNELQLGQWQRVLFVELDRSRDRKIQLQILGE
jgi:secondary thiamine-phosphate synthase enzyme